MRITVVGPSYPFRGGIAHYTSLLCKALSARHEVKLVSLSRQYPRILFPGKTQTDDSQVKIAVDGAERIVDSMNPLSWYRAAKLIQSFTPDLVIIQWWHPFFAPAFGTIAAKCSKFSDVMFLCHNVLPHEKGGPIKIFTKSALSKGDLFIVHSDEDAFNLKVLMPTAKVKKARHPTYEVFSQQPIDRQESRKALGLPSDGNIILFFGLVREYKGLKYLIDAIPKVLESLDITPVIAGEFYDDKEKYIRQIKDLGLEDRVHLHDKYIPNEEVGTYFSAADLLVLPYISATQSGIVQIAYGFDRPVVTTNVGGLPEAVTHEKTGFVVPPENSKALADAIVRFFRENKAEQFSTNIKAIKDEFSWDRMVEAIEDLALNHRAKKC